MTQTAEPLIVNGVVARHSSKSNEHYTPPRIVEPSRVALGGIDLDPASCPLANTTVKAQTIYTQEDSGLDKPWRGRVLLNAPGGKQDGHSAQKLWWFKLASEWMVGHATAAIFVGFSVEILQTTQVKRPDGLPVPAELPHCFPSRRVAYLKNEGGALVPGTSPPHSSVIIYLPPRDGADSWAAGIARFRAAFSDVGAVCGPLESSMWVPK